MSRIEVLGLLDGIYNRGINNKTKTISELTIQFLLNGMILQKRKGTIFLGDEILQGVSQVIPGIVFLTETLAPENHLEKSAKSALDMADLFIYSFICKNDNKSNETPWEEETFITTSVFYLSMF